jgi:hypothetical protein
VDSCASATRGAASGSRGRGRERVRGRCAGGRLAGRGSLFAHAHANRPRAPLHAGRYRSRHRSHPRWPRKPVAPKCQPQDPRADGARWPAARRRRWPQGQPQRGGARHLIKNCVNREIEVPGGSARVLRWGRRLRTERILSSRRAETHRKTLLPGEQPAGE